MELIEPLLVVSVATQTASTVILSILGEATPKAMKVLAWIASALVIVFTSVMLATIEERSKQGCPKYRKIEEPVYTLIK